MLQWVPCSFSRCIEWHYRFKHHYSLPAIWQSSWQLLFSLHTSIILLIICRNYSYNLLISTIWPLFVFRTFYLFSYTKTIINVLNNACFIFKFFLWGLQSDVCVLMIKAGHRYYYSICSFFGVNLIFHFDILLLMAKCKMGISIKLCKTCTFYSKDNYFIL